jgi:TonB-linked SusC/RagA family outer membrane protein
MNKNPTLLAGKLKGLGLAFLATLMSFSLFAQQAGNISGTVTASGTGEALVGVTVQVQGTSRGTTSGANGHYTLDASPGDSLVFTYIGFDDLHLVVGNSSTLNASLQASAKGLNEVVVTALGLEKSAISTPYTTQAVSGDELNRVKSPNLMNSLAGKAAGVVITQGSAGPGSSANVILRGYKSITGNNQPLYVIDGVPMSNPGTSQAGGLNSSRSADGGDAISNLNPEDIQDITVLTGASAAALYGSRAANGVILITTKKGKLGVSSVSVSSSATFSNPISLPELQTEYGQGAGGVLNTTVNDSWGPRIDNGSDAHLKDFFQTGQTYINAVSVTRGNETGAFYLSYANTNAKGIVPENTYNRNNFTIEGSSNLFNDKVTVQGSMNYINQISRNRPSAGWYNSPMFGLYLFPVGDDFSKYSGANYQKFDSTRNMYVQNWPYVRNEASSNQNPYWIQNKIQSDEYRSRSIYSFNAKWHILNWLTLSGRVNYDRSEDRFEQRSYATSDPTTVGANGKYVKIPSTTEQLYTDFLLTGNKQLGTDFSLAATLGFSVTQNKFQSIDLETNGATTSLYYPNFFSVYALDGAFTHTETYHKSLSQAVFGTATLGYKQTVFLDVTGRNERSSTVNDPFFYPSIGLTYVLTNTLAPSDFFSFAKLRASYAEVGNALPFGVANNSPNYTLSQNGNINGRGSMPFFSGTDTISLKPERTRSFEFGADFRFFRDKLSLSLTYYHATTDDQVFQIGAPAGAGANNFWINGGTILNKGVEAMVSYDASFGQVKWSPSLTFSRNINQIRKLSDLLTADRFVLNSGFRLTQLFLTRPGSETLGGRKYGSYGDIFGRTYQRDDHGNILYGDDGLPLLSAANDQYLGNAHPDFLMGFNNSFTYKNFSLHFLVDGRFGGVIASSKEQWLDFKGLSKRTGVARDNGGVMVNGQLIDAETYYQYISGKADIAAAAEEYIYSATNVRLRELSISYAFPKFSNVFKDLSVSLVGHNLFFFYKKAPFDPDVSISTANSLQGMDGFQIPTTRSYGITLSAKF